MAFKLIELDKAINSITGTVIRQFGIAVGNFALTILLFRSLGSQEVGLFYLSILLPTLAAMLLDFGISESNSYYLSRRLISINTITWTISKLWFFLCFVGILISGVIIYFWSNKFFPGLPSKYLWIALPIFPITLLAAFMSSIIRGVHDFACLSKMTFSSLITTLFLTILLVSILKWGVIGGIISLVIGKLLEVLVGSISIYNLLKKDDKVILMDNYIKNSINYGWKLYASQMLSYLSYRSDIFLVNLFLTPSSAGIYLAATQLSEQFWILSRGVAVALLPHLASVQNDKNTVNRLTPLIARWVFFLSFIAAVTIASAGQTIIKTLYGLEYDMAYIALLGLLPGTTLLSSARILAVDTAARGHPETNLHAAGAAFIVNIGANLILIPKIGILGAALASTIAYSINAILQVYYYSILSTQRWWIVFRPTNEDLQLLYKAISFFLQKKR